MSSKCKSCNYEYCPYYNTDNECFYEVYAIPLQTEEIDYDKGYKNGRNDTINQTVEWLKEYLYEKNYVGIIDLVDDYINKMLYGK